MIDSERRIGGLFLKKYLLGMVMLVLLATACKAEEKEQVIEDAEQLNKITAMEVITGNLKAPWAIEKWGDIFYLTERVGTIVQVQDGEKKRQEVQLEYPLSTASEAGLLGFVLAPDFSSSNEAFAYYTYEKGDEQFNRVVLLQLDNGVWYEQDMLIDGIPSGTYHHGGRLKIGPDNKLYVTAGDASNPQLAQNKESLAGKILRMNLDGSIPEDNPFNQSYVYSYGHRNPQGLAWSTEGVMYATEHGQSANDEVNEIIAGANYGWPVIEGTEKQDEMIAPLFTSGKERTWAPSGMAYHQEVLYVAALRGTALLAFDLQTDEIREVVNDVGRIRDVWLDDGSLYFITNNTDGRGQANVTDDRLFKMELSKIKTTNEESEQN